jgi:thioredoxin 2
MQIVCTQCSAKNRVPDDKLDHVLACGKCGVDLMTSEPFDLNDQTFERYIAGTELPIVIDFWATWCGPCQSMAPHFKTAAQTLSKVKFAKVDSDQAKLLSQRYGIKSIPTLILFSGGKEFARRSGALSASELVNWISNQLRARGIQ